MHQPQPGNARHQVHLSGCDETAILRPTTCLRWRAGAGIRGHLATRPLSLPATKFRRNRRSALGAGREMGRMGPFRCQR